MNRRNRNASSSTSECSSISSISSVASDIAQNYRFLEYKIVQGERITAKLLYTLEEKQFYRFNRETANFSAYLCPEYGCNCRVHIRKDGKCLQFDKYKGHNHGTKERKYEELHVLNLIKEKCADLRTLLNEKKQAVRDIFYSVMSEYPNVEIDFFKVERTLQSIRKATLQKNPASCDDIAKIFARDDIFKLIGTTKDGQQFYNGVFESDEFSYCVLSSPTSIELFKKHEPNGCIVMDATFDVVPLDEFNQLFAVDNSWSFY